MKKRLLTKNSALFLVAGLEIVASLGIGLSVRSYALANWQTNHDLGTISNSGRLPLALLELSQANPVIKVNAASQATLILTSNGEKAHNLDVTLNFPPQIQIDALSFPNPLCQPLAKPKSSQTEVSFSCLNASQKPFGPVESLVTLQYHSSQTGIFNFQVAPSTLITDQNAKNSIQKSIPLAITVTQ